MRRLRRVSAHMLGGAPAHASPYPLHEHLEATNRLLLRHPSRRAVLDADLSPGPLAADPVGADQLELTPEEIRFFKANGYLIKRNLLPRHTLEPFIDAFWETVEAGTGCVRRGDPESYVDAGERWPCDGVDGRPQKNHTHGGLCLSGPSLGSGGGLHWDCSHLPGFLEATSASPQALHVVE